MFRCKQTWTKKEVTITSKVFVGNLSYDTNQGDLESLFSEAGEVVEVFLPSDRMTGRPRGFAFVEFADHSSVSEAIEKFDGEEVQGRSIRVSEAQERAPRPSSFPDPGGGGFQRPGGKKFGKSKGSRRNLRNRKRGF